MLKKILLPVSAIALMMFVACGSDSDDSPFMPDNDIKSSSSIADDDEEEYVSSSSSVEKEDKSSSSVKKPSSSNKDDDDKPSIKDDDDKPSIKDDDDKPSIKDDDDKPSIKDDDEESSSSVKPVSGRASCEFSEIFDEELNVKAGIRDSITMVIKVYPNEDGGVKAYIGSTFDKGVSEKGMKRVCDDAKELASEYSGMTECEPSDRTIVVTVSVGEVSYNQAKILLKKRCNDIQESGEAPEFKELTDYVLGAE